MDDVTTANLLRDAEVLKVIRAPGDQYSGALVLIHPDATVTAMWFTDRTEGVTTWDSPNFEAFARDWLLPDDEIVGKEDVVGWSKL